MAKKAYVGIANLPKNVSDIYVGVNNAPKKVIKGYVGVNGVPMLFWDSNSEEEDGWNVIPLFFGDSNQQIRYYNKNYILANFDDPSYIRIANQTINIDNYTYKGSENIVTTGTFESVYNNIPITYPYISTGSPNVDTYASILCAYRNSSNSKEKQMIYIPVKNLKNIIKLFVRVRHNSPGYINIGIAKFNNSTQQLDYSKIFALNIPNTFNTPLPYQNSTNFSINTPDFTQKPLKSVQSFYSLVNETVLELDFRYLWDINENNNQDLAVNADFLVFGLYNWSTRQIEIKEVSAIIGKKENIYINSNSTSSGPVFPAIPDYPKKPYSHITDRFISTEKTKVLFGIKQSTDKEVSYDGSGNPQIRFYMSRNKQSSQYITYNYTKKIYIGLTKITGTLKFPYRLNQNEINYGNNAVINGAIIFAIPNFVNVSTDVNTVLNSMSIGNWNIDGYVNPDDQGDSYYEQYWQDDYQSLFNTYSTMAGTYIHSQQNIWSYVVMLGDITQYVLNPRVKGFGGTYKNIQASYDINIIDRTNIAVENFIEDLYNDGLA